MIKDKNTRIIITISKKANDRIDFIVKHTNKKKSQIVEDLILQKTSIKKLWKEIDPNDLSEADNVYYVKSILESDYLPNMTHFTNYELAKKHITYKNITLSDYKILNDFIKSRENLNNLGDWMS